jgi:Zn-dependent protease/predicted transcriptional regulator
MRGRSVRIARISGFDVKVGASWLLIATLVVWSLATSYFPAELAHAPPVTHLVLAFVGLAGLFASILLHELGHSIAARAQGVQVSSITLFVFGGVAEIKGGLPSPLTELWIAVMGPIVSLGLAVLLWFCARLAEAGGAFGPTAAVLGYLSFLNLFLGLGNLIPAYPLDGGRILRAIYWFRSGDLVDATLRASRLSTMLSTLLIVLGLFAVFSGDAVGGLWPIVIGLFLFSTNRSSRNDVQLLAALDGRTVADLMSRDPCTARPDQSLSEVVSLVFLDRGVSFAPVVEDEVVLGYVDTHLVRRIDRENWTTTVVDDVIESITEDNSVSPDLPCRDLLDRISRTGRRKFMVVVGTALVGVVTLSDLVSYLNVAEELQG